MSVMDKIRLSLVTEKVVYTLDNVNGSLGTMELYPYDEVTDPEEPYVPEQEVDNG